MAVIIKETSIAATTTVENLFSGSAFEFARQDQLCSLGVTGSATGSGISFGVGDKIGFPYRVDSPSDFIVTNS